MKKSGIKLFMALSVSIAMCTAAIAAEGITKDEQRAEQLKKLQEDFAWWGETDAQPAPVKDQDRGGYWWMPKGPGPTSPKIWGNRGYIYVYKIIFDYKEEDLPAPKPQEMRPSLLIKKIIKNVKIYFDYDKDDLRDDAMPVLENGVGLLKTNRDASILITGNCDVRGTEKYNDKLGKLRGQAVKKFMLESGIPEERIKIISRGKLDAIAPVTDLIGMAKDRNAQFMVAHVEEVMIPYSPKAQAGQAVEGQAVTAAESAKPEGSTQIGEGKYVIEKEEQIESEIKVSTKEYIAKKGDTLWKIAEDVYGDGKKWNNIYRMNKDRIKDPNKLQPGTRLVIPIE